MNVYSFDRKLLEEEKKLSKLLEKLSHKNDLSKIGSNNNNNNDSSLTRLFSETKQESKGIQVTEDEIFLNIEGVLAFSEQEQNHNSFWETEIINQLENDEITKSLHLKEELEETKNKLIIYENSIIELMKWKNSRRNQMALLLQSLETKLTLSHQSNPNHKATSNKELYTNIQEILLKLKLQLKEPVQLPISLKHLDLIPSPQDTSPIKNTNESKITNIEKTKTLNTNIICPNCSNVNKLESMKKTKIDSKHEFQIIDLDQEEILVKVFTLLTEIQAESENRFQNEYVIGKKTTINYIEKRIFLLFLFGVEVFNIESIFFENASGIYETIYYESSKKLEKQSKGLLYQDFVFALTSLAELKLSNEVKQGKSPLNILLGHIFQKVDYLIHRPGTFYELVKTFWSLANENIYSLMSQHIREMYRYFKRSKNYGLMKHIKFSTSDKVSFSGSGYELFCVNIDIVPKRIHPGAARRISQYLTSMYSKDGLCYFVACLYQTCLYLHQAATKGQYSTIDILDIPESYLSSALEDLVVHFLRNNI